jgi:hypothetical protein
MREKQAWPVVLQPFAWVAREGLRDRSGRYPEGWAPMSTETMSTETGG